jgi:hypothetical protein
MPKRRDSPESEPPIKGFSIFLRERHHSVKMEDPGLTLTQRSAQLGAERAGDVKSGQANIYQRSKAQNEEISTSSS